MFLPTARAKKNQAIAVAGPFGGVKEMASGLYAQEFAGMGFVAMAFDQSFTGETVGESDRRRRLALSGRRRRYSRDEYEFAVVSVRFLHKLRRYLCLISAVLLYVLGRYMCALRDLCDRFKLAALRYLYVCFVCHVRYLR